MADFVWGAIIQANGMVWQKDWESLPGEVVYSLEEHPNIDVDELVQICQALGALKGTKPTDADLLKIANYLTNETIRVHGLAVPQSISPTFRCKISTTCFVRKHLPGRRLCQTVLPIVVNPREPNVTMPLPARYWPPELLDWWGAETTEE